MAGRYVIPDKKRLNGIRQPGKIRMIGEMGSPKEQNQKQTRTAEQDKLADKLEWDNEAIVWIVGLAAGTVRSCRTF